MLSKILGGVSLALVIGIYLLYQANIKKAEDIATLESSILQHKQNYLDKVLENKKLKAEVLRVEKITYAREVTIRDIADRNNELQSKLSDLEHEKPVVKNYLDVSIPTDVVELLKQSSTSNNQDSN